MPALLLEPLGYVKEPKLLPKEALAAERAWGNPYWLVLIRDRAEAMSGLPR